MNRFVCALTILALMIAVIGCGDNFNNIENRQAPTVTDNLEITALDVGKADCILLKTKEHCVLIDTGEKSSADDIMEMLVNNNIDTIDYMIVTHFDKDHVGGASSIIEKMPINNIITPNYEGNNKQYEKFVSAMENANITPIKLTANVSFTIDDTLFQIYPPMEEEYEESDNDYSLVTYVTHGRDTMLFAGDAEQTRLQELKSQMNIKADLLKVPHHGRYNNYTATFFNDVSPKYAIITDSEKEQADDTTIDILYKNGCKIFCTKDGTIKAISTGTGIDVTQ